MTKIVRIWSKKCSDHVCSPCKSDDRIWR